MWWEFTAQKVLVLRVSNSLLNLPASLFPSLGTYRAIMKMSEAEQSFPGYRGLPGLVTENWRNFQTNGLKVLHEFEWYFYQTDSSISLNEQVIQSKGVMQKRRPGNFLVWGPYVSTSDPKHTCAPIFGARNTPSKSLLPKQMGQAHETHTCGVHPALFTK